MGCRYRKLRINGILRLLVAVAAWSAFVSGTANAQVDGYYEPPIQTFDRNAVDINNKAFSYKIHEIKVGPDDDIPLSYYATIGTPPSFETYNLNAYIICDCSTQDNVVGEVPWTNVTSGSEGSGGGIDLVYNGHTYQHYFNQQEGVSSKIIPIAGDPNGGAIQFTIADGTILNFPLSDLHCGIMCINVNYIEFPNGMAWFYQYDPPTTVAPYGQSMAGAFRSIYTSRGYGVVLGSSQVSTFSKNCSTSTTYCNLKPEANTYNETTDASGNIYTAITDPSGVVTTLKQEPVDTNIYQITQITRSDLAAPLITNAYNVDHHYFFNPFVRSYLISQTNGSGNVTQYPIANNNVINADGSTDQYGFVVTNYVYSDVSSHTDPLGRTVQIDRDIVMHPLKQTNAEGDVILYTRDARGNVTERRHKAKPSAGAGIPDIVESWGFPATCSDANFRICNEPTYYIDARGGRTDYQYDPAHGGVIVALAPADQNNKRSVIRYAYSSFYPAANSVAPPGVTLKPVYKLATVTTCRSSTVTGTTIDFTFSCSSPDATTTFYEYQPSTQAVPSSFLMVGKTIVSAGAVLRTCYTYDVRGNRVSESSPRAGLSTCS